MRIGLAGPCLGFHGGTERHLHDLARALGGRGHEVTLVHGDRVGRDVDAFCEPFRRVVALRGGGASAGLDVVYAHNAANVDDLEPFGRTPMAIATHDHDLTCPRTSRYLPVTLSPCHRAPGLCCVGFGCVVVRRRGPGPRLPIGLRSPFALRARLLALASRAPLVANSRYIADSLVRAGVDPARTRVIHPIPPAAPVPPAPRPDNSRVLVVGNLLRGKGVDIAIDALRYLPAAVGLDVVGDGPSRDALGRRAERVAPGRVRFHGHVRPERTWAAYDGASVVAVPSRWPEPFGMVGIEAMRRARPVAGAAHGGIPEWLEDGVGGRLFEPGSARDLARAIASLLDDRGAGERALACAEARFQHAASVDAVESLLVELAGGDVSAAPAVAALSPGEAGHP